MVANAIESNQDPGAGINWASFSTVNSKGHRRASSFNSNSAGSCVVQARHACAFPFGSALAARTLKNKTYVPKKVVAITTYSINLTKNRVLLACHVGVKLRLLNVHEIDTRGIDDNTAFRVLILQPPN